MSSPTLAGKSLTDYHHVCAFFDSRDDEYRVLSPFFAEGVRAGATRCSTLSTRR